jgi:hypothetical protein
MLELSRDGEVFVLRMQGGENRMQPDFVHAWNAALDEVEGASWPSRARRRRRSAATPSRRAACSRWRTTSA